MVARKAEAYLIGIVKEASYKIGPDFKSDP